MTVTIVIVIISKLPWMDQGVPELPRMLSTSSSYRIPG